MDPDTPRRSSRYGNSEPYWRRRASVLAGLLALIGLFAWACSGALRTDDKQSVAGGGTESAAPSDGATAEPAATVTVTATPAHSSSPTPSGGACRPDDVVLTLASTRDTYEGEDRPAFRVTAVNTGEATCTFDAGPEKVVTAVESDSGQVWSSGHCARDPSEAPSSDASSDTSGADDATARLERGVPYTTTVEWDRERSTRDDCGAQGSAAGPGAYTATASAVGIETDPVEFRLG